MLGRVAVDPHEHLVEVLAPAGIRMVLDTALSDLGSKYRAELVPPETYRFMANIDAAFEQQILDEKRYGRPLAIVTDRLRSYGAAMKVIGNLERQVCGIWLNNRAENSHQPFRRTAPPPWPNGSQLAP